MAVFHWLLAFDSIKFILYNFFSEQFEKLTKKEECVSNLTIVIQHQLRLEESLRRLKTLIEDLKARFTDKITKLEQRWIGNKGTFSFDVKGRRVSGTIEAGPSQAKLELNLPASAMFFKGKIEKIVREKAREILGSEPNNNPVSSPRLELVLFCGVAGLLVLGLCGFKKHKISREEAKGAVRFIYTK